MTLKKKNYLLVLDSSFVSKSKLFEDKINTYPTSKALWMPLSVQSRNVVLHDWHATATTFGSKHLEIILPVYS